MSHDLVDEVRAAADRADVSYLTEEIPKPLVRILGRPMLEGILEALGAGGRLAEAKDAFRREIAEFPQSLRPYADLGRILAMEGDPDGARAAIDAMARANPAPQVYLYAARLLDGIGDPEGAARWRQAAAELAP